MKKQTQFTILENAPLTASVYRMVLRGDTSAITAPGQFVNIALDGKFLRRPISVCDYDASTLTLIYKVVGSGTAQLSAMGGGTLDILTGLGNGYDISAAGDAPVLIGGGVGVAPVRCAMYAFATKESRAFFGYRTKNHVYALENLPCEADIVTDDGSMGEKALVTAPLLRAIAQKRPDLMMACGPGPMLRAIQKIALEQQIPCQISLEEHMGCGIGACLGCTCKIKIKDGEAYKRVCMDVPVFTAEEVCFFD